MAFGGGRVALIDRPRSGPPIGRAGSPARGRELTAAAARHGWNVVGPFEGAGISGAKGRDRRPGLDAVMKVVARREVDMVAAWSVDRLGRSLIDLHGFLGELHSKGGAGLVDLLGCEAGVGDESTDILIGNIPFA